jgi:protein TonB
MLISKFDLYKSEWLELVFDDRNKEYGAYELRRHYSRTMVVAMCFAFLGVTGAALIVGIIIRPVVESIHPTVYVNHVFKLIEPPVIEHPHLQPIPPAPHHSTTPPAPPSTASVTKYVPLVISDKPITTEPPKVDQIKGDVGQVDIQGKGPSIGPTSIPGDGKAPGVSDVPVGTDMVQRMPEPFGGAAAWSKFLKSHLKYPDGAIQNSVQGRVWVTFIVERDGTLSNFKVDRGPGFGLDEEALRVLKLAPAWRPGISNGQPVRVRYNIPINFALGDDGN